MNGEIPLSVPTDKLDCALEKLLLLHRAKDLRYLSWDAILERYAPGIIEQIGSIDAMPSVEGYFYVCEVLDKVFKPVDSDDHE